MTGRSIEALEPAPDGGFDFLCDCGTRTHVHILFEETDAQGAIVGGEFSVTCDGCETSHWFSYRPPPEEP